MKTALISVLTATLLGSASRLSGRAFDAADFTAILFTTGLRISEVLGLSWEDIDLDAGTARVRRAVTAAKAGRPELEADQDRGRERRASPRSDCD